MTGLPRVRVLQLVVLLVCSLNTVTCQLTVAAMTGDDVLLPCIYSEAERPPGTTSVLWRDGDDRVVLDITAAKEEFSTQDPKFKGRVSSDQALFKKGNFSIVMKNVQQSDSGPYECYMLRAEVQRSVTLTVSGLRAEATTPPPGQSGGSGAVTATLSTWLLLLLFFSL